MKDLDTAIHDKIGDKLSEKRVSLAGLCLPPIEIFEDYIDLDDTSDKP